MHGGTVVAYEYWRSLPSVTRGIQLSLTVLEWQRRGISRMLTENGPDLPAEVSQFLAALKPADIRPVITPSLITLPNIQGIMTSDPYKQIVAISLCDEPKTAEQVRNEIAPLAKQCTALGIPVTVTLNPPSWGTFWNNIGDALPCFKMLLFDCYPKQPTSGPETWWSYFPEWAGRFCAGKCAPLGITPWVIFQAYEDKNLRNPLTLPTPSEIRLQVKICRAIGAEAALAFGPAPNAAFKDDSTWVAISQEFNRMGN